MDEDKTCDCGMPLTEETECKCQPDVCIHCCTCSDDCECGCKEKAAKEDAAEDEDTDKEE
jgi:hypothetical protein